MLTIRPQPRSIIAGRAAWVRTNGAGEHRREHRVPALQREVDDGCDVLEAGRVDEDVEPSVPLDDVGDHRPAGLGIGEVDRCGVGPRQAGRRLPSPGLVAVGDDDCCAVGCQDGCDRPADAAGAAGHHGDSVGQRAALPDPVARRAPIRRAQWMIRCPRSRSNRWMRPGASVAWTDWPISRRTSGATRATTVASPRRQLDEGVRADRLEQLDRCAEAADRRARRRLSSGSGRPRPGRRAPRSASRRRAGRGAAASRARSAGPAKRTSTSPSDRSSAPSTRLIFGLPDERGDVEVASGCGRSRGSVPSWTTLPSRMTAIRSDSVIASSWSWVTKTLVVPSVRWRCLTSVRIRLRRPASRLLNGSSSRKTSGSLTSARPSATRCCWPPDIWPGLRFIRWVMSSASATASTRALISAFGRCWSLRPNAMLSNAVRCGIERVVLEHHRHPPLVGRRRRDVLVAEEDPALVEPVEPGDQVEGRALAAARRAEQRDERAGRDVDRQVVDRLDRRRSGARSRPAGGRCRPCAWWLPLVDGGRG